VQKTNPPKKQTAVNFVKTQAEPENQFFATLN